jgi:lipopolysaccharide cholinephosphotransferase
MSFEKGEHFINKEVMIRNLGHVKEVYDRYNIPFFFIFGTLLGAIREGDFITYDNDVDLGALWEYRDRILLASKELELLGFITDYSVSPFDINYIKDNEKIEIWLFQKDDINRTRVYDPSRCVNIKYQESFIEKLEDITFKGLSFKVPSNPKEFLRVTYGDSWTTPKKHAGYIL